MKSNEKKKVALASCNGMSPFGLITRASVSDLSEENENIISICITATSADSESFNQLIKKYPIISVNGCSNSCVNTILSKKGIKVKKTIDSLDFANKNNLKPGKVSRLGDEGEKTVTELKKEIKRVLSDI